MTNKDLDEETLRAAARLDPPGPSPDLLRKVQAMKPVKTRSRLGALLAVLLAGSIGPTLTVLRSRRPDLGALPPLWVVAGAAIWGLAFLGALAAALVPARGDVLPSATRASRVAAVALGALLAFAAFATVSVPGISLQPEDVHKTLLGSCLDCAGYAFSVGTGVIVLGALILRRVLPMGRQRIGLALGAAGGAAGGLALHFHCGIAVTAHVVGGHVGAVALSALVGAVLLPRFVER